MATDRYHRQTLLPGIGAEGQEKIGRAHAVIVGVGALGCAAADLLGRAGVGRLTLIDRDVVELTNLQRQTLYGEADVKEGLPKAQAARRRLMAVNSAIEVKAVVADFTPMNAEELLALPHAKPTMLVDGTDNFETRYLLNDIAIKHGVPYLYAGVVGTTGMTFTVIPGVTPCLRCVFEEAPAPGTTPTCDTAGVLGPAVAMVGGFQVADAIKLMTGQAVPPVLTSFDLWTGRVRRLDVASAGPSAACRCCGRRKFEFLHGDHAADAVSLCGQNAVQISPAVKVKLDLVAAAARLRPVAEVVVNEFLLKAKFTGTPIEVTLFPDARAIVHGTNKPEVARSVYAKYVGA